MEKDMNQFSENKQSYMLDNNSMQNLNLASAGDGLVGGVQAEVVSGIAGEILGGKYDESGAEEHDVADDDELKYVEEVQQSEKQQQQQLQALKNFGLDENNEFAEKETTNNAAHEFEIGNGGFVFGGDHQIYQQHQHHDLFNVGNGHDANGHDNNVNMNEGFGNLISSGFEEKLNMMESELDGFKNEGDFSATLNVTESIEDFVPQVDVKIEKKVEQQDMLDEEEPSSLATNTTNGTSSLSENIPAQSVSAPQADVFDELMDNVDDKENSDPLTPQRPNDLDLQQAHSHLNPDAKEFIPSFGSNPVSPTSPFATGIPQNEPVLSDIMETQMYFGQAPVAVPRHIMTDDDFVAQSPHKGKTDKSMDAVPLPTELSEFEEEADKRPHEPQSIDDMLQRDEVMTPDQATQQLPLDLLTQEKENHQLMDTIDFQPSNYMDHGPETCVDLDTDLDVQPSDMLASLQDEHCDVMKRSIYVASDDAIEDVLNSVQPLPLETESGNSSFIEESDTESAAIQYAGDKELLQVEEKEHVSQSPSIEEIQMNLLNTLNSSNKDIPQLLIDMDNANNMQESVYVEHEKEQVTDHQERDKPLQDEEQFVSDQMSQTPLVEEHELSQENKESQQVLQIENQPEKELEHFQKENQYQEKTKGFQEELMHGEQLKEVNEVKDIENASEQNYEKQQLLKESSEKLNEKLQDEEHPPQDQVTGTFLTEVAEESLLTDATNPLTYNDNILRGELESQEHKQEINDSFSALENPQEVAKTAVNAYLESDEPVTQQEPNIIDVAAMPAFTADEKHLFEETKEQQLFSISGLEQQMSEMMLNNTDSNLSQAEEVVVTTATGAVEEVSQNLITTEEAYEEEEQYHQHHHGEKEQEEETEPQNRTLQLTDDDSFLQHEREFAPFDKKIEMNIDVDQKTEFKNVLVHDSVESPIEHQHQQILDCEMVVDNEPAIEAKEAEPYFTNKETDINVNITKTEEEQELPACLLPETVPAEVVLPSINTPNEIEIVQSEQDVKQQTIEEVKTETMEEPSVEELKAEEAEIVIKEEIKLTPEVKLDVPIEAAIVAATAAVVTTAAVAEKVASPADKNKSETNKKPSSKTTTTATATAAKPKVGAASAAKKPVEAAKKPVALAAKPRTVPAKPAAVAADKKPVSKITATSTTTTARKIVSSTTTTASKVAAKTTTTTSATTRTVTATSKTATSTKPTTAPRTLSSNTTAARKPAATNGPLTKPRPVSGPAKPTTLGLPAMNGAPKAKPASPRAPLISQARKTTPPTTAAKSPLKPTTTNGVTKPTTSTLASRTKTITSTVSSTAGATSKTFTARPAPKFTGSLSSATTTTTAKRLTIAGSTAASTTSSTKTSTTPMRKSSPTKSTTGRTLAKPTTQAGALKPKSPVTKPAVSPSGKPAPIRKPISAAEKTAIPAEEQLKLATIENGDLQAVKLEQQEQNGDSNIPMQTEQQQQTYLEPRDEKMPMDLGNA